MDEGTFVNFGGFYNLTPSSFLNVNLTRSDEIISKSIDLIVNFTTFNTLPATSILEIFISNQLETAATITCEKLSFGSYAVIPCTTTSSSEGKTIKFDSYCHNSGECQNTNAYTIKLLGFSNTPWIVDPVTKFC